MFENNFWEINKEKFFRDEIMCDVDSCRESCSNFQQIFVRFYEISIIVCILCGRLTISHAKKQLS